MKITTYLKNNIFGVLYTVELPDCEQLSKIVYLCNLLEKNQQSSVFTSTLSRLDVDFIRQTLKVSNNS